MFFSLLVVTLALALAVAAGTAHAFTKPIDRILAARHRGDAAVFFVFALIAFVVVRFAESRRAAREP